MAGEVVAGKRMSASKFVTVDRDIASNLPLVIL